MSSATTIYDFAPEDSKLLLRTTNTTHPTRQTCAYTYTNQNTKYSPERGNRFPLSSLRGKVVLVVNTASKCGFTPQFKSRETLYKSLSASHPDKFTILGFPCNQFASQDPGTNDEIQNFCQINYGVTFPMLAKIDVNGDNAAPLYTWMKAEIPGLMGMKRIKWNFEKFLISADGKVVGRWASITKPESLEGAILKEIEKTETAPAAAKGESEGQTNQPQAQAESTTGDAKS